MVAQKFTVSWATKFTVSSNHSVQHHGQPHYRSSIQCHPTPPAPFHARSSVGRWTRCCSRQAAGLWVFAVGASRRGARRAFSATAGRSVVASTNPVVTLKEARIKVRSWPPKNCPPPPPLKVFVGQFQGKGTPFGSLLLCKKGNFNEKTPSSGNTPVGCALKGSPLTRVLWLNFLCLQYSGNHIMIGAVFVFLFGAGRS